MGPSRKVDTMIGLIILMSIPEDASLVRIVAQGALALFMLYNECKLGGMFDYED